jgi:hypothetical protein
MQMLIFVEIIKVNDSFLKHVYYVDSIFEFSIMYYKPSGNV